MRDLVRAAKFYDPIMDALGYRRVHRRDEAIGYDVRNNAADDGHSHLTIRLDDQPHHA